MELLLICCAVFVLQFGQKAEGYEVGAPCNYDSDCFIENSFCRNQQVCECKRNFLPSEDHQMCIAAVGAVCETKYDCSTLDHSDCQQYVCECEKGFVPDPKGNSCLPRTLNIKGPCQQDIQCQVSFGDQSRCESSACVCLPQNHFINGQCFRNRGLDEHCRNNSDCYIGDDFIHKVTCRSGQCRCADGYTKDAYNKCQRSSGQRTAPSVFYILIGFLTGAVGYIRQFFKGISKLFR